MGPGQILGLAHSSHDAQNDQPQIVVERGDGRSYLGAITSAPLAESIFQRCYRVPSPHDAEAQAVIEPQR